jgi:hypothetical protein
MKSRFPFGHAAVYAIAVTAVVTPAAADPYLLELGGIRGESPEKKRPPPPPPPPKSRPQQSKNVQAPGSGPQEGLLLPAIQSAREAGGSGHSPPPPPPPPPKGNQAETALNMSAGNASPRRSRPNIAVGDLNGDGRADASGRHIRNVKLTPRKSGGTEAAQRSQPAQPISR